MWLGGGGTLEGSQGAQEPNTEAPTGGYPTVSPVVSSWWLLPCQHHGALVMSRAGSWRAVPRERGAGVHCPPGGSLRASPPHVTPELNVLVVALNSVGPHPPGCALGALTNE